MISTAIAIRLKSIFVIQLQHAMQHGRHVAQSSQKVGATTRPDAKILAQLDLLKHEVEYEGVHRK